MHCQNCGRRVDEDSSYCPKCGENLVGGTTRLKEWQIMDDINDAKSTAKNHAALGIVIIRTTEKTPDFNPGDESAY